jgi:hypothetical protein
MLYIEGETFVDGGCPDGEQASSGKVPWLFGRDSSYGMTSEAVGTLPRRPTEDRRLSVGVIG